MFALCSEGLFYSIYHYFFVSFFFSASLDRNPAIFSRLVCFLVWIHDQLYYVVFYLGNSCIYHHHHHISLLCPSPPIALESCFMNWGLYLDLFRDKTHKRGNPSIDEM